MDRKIQGLTRFVVKTAIPYFFPRKIWQQKLELRERGQWDKRLLVIFPL